MWVFFTLGLIPGGMRFMAAYGYSNPGTCAMLIDAAIYEEFQRDIFDIVTAMDFVEVLIGYNWLLRAPQYSSSSSSVSAGTVRTLNPKP